jgi:MerR family transcriptional regulator, light-induced transcriptional regulator
LYPIRHLRSLLEVTEKSVGADNSKKPKPVDVAALDAAARLARLYLDALRAADAAGAYRIASEALAEGIEIPELYQRVIRPAMYEVGKLWEKGALTVADEHLATALTHRVLAALRPPLRVDTGAGAASPRKRAMLAAVEGEQHALGLRMAADVLEDAGFETIYLGADVPTGALLQAVDSLAPDLLGLSATMPELAPRLAEVVASVREGHPGLELLVGGQAAAPRTYGALVDDLEALPGELASGR